MISINSIDHSEALRYLGYGENPADKNIQNILDECEQLLLKVISPKYLYKCLDITIDSDKISLVNCNLALTGNDIKEHLTDCTKVVLMCATLSAEADKLIRTTQIADMTNAVIIDSLASAAVEQLCNSVEEEIQAEFPKLHKTWRYSPGYGDFPIDIQREFLTVLNAPKKIGLCASQSNILTPRKSVTAIIGLSQNEVLHKNRGCLSCNLRETCTFRRKGEHCGF